MARLGGVIQILREERRWTQLDLAKAADVPPSTISKIETGQQQGARPDTLARLGQAFGMTAEELLAEAERRDPSDLGGGVEKLQKWLDQDFNLTESQKKIMVSIYVEYARYNEELARRSR